MPFSDTDTVRIRTEKRLQSNRAGFTESYLAVQYICDHLENHPESVTRQTTQSLIDLIDSNRFNKKKQAYFLYREAAQALIHIALDITHPLAEHAILKLQDILLSSNGKKHRAVSEVLGSLPVNITGPDIRKFDEKEIRQTTFDRLLSGLGNPDPEKMAWHGRTLRFQAEKGKIGCIKFANTRENIAQLSMEAHWLNFLKTDPPCADPLFKIPTPFCIDGKYIFRMSDNIDLLPDLIVSNKKIFPQYTAIAFLADPEYFHYPNDPDLFNTTDDRSITGIFERNARLLGEMTSRGLIHTALIPLFHNRVQQSRRQDGGLYIWERGGRLDRWLESSLYPNFAVSGLRDFEHLVSIKSTRDIRHFIGEHILGFVLVLGSFFRNRAPDKIGLDDDGLPVDTRDLFDPVLFSEILRSVVAIYYQSITGSPLKRIDHFFTDGLVEELILHMGVDTHMEETLRIQDQQEMSDADFKSFLLSRGMERSQADRTVRGEDDIVLMTGPHLGGFNQPISVPRLVEFLFCLSSLCVSDRYLMENGLKAFMN